jgi:uncharacterized membrane protein HdeD (DUF308 family)
MNNISHRRFDWFSLIIGILFLIGGFLSFSKPDKTLHLLSVIIGVVFLIDGLYELTIRRRFLLALDEHTAGVVVLGILNIILGIIFIFRPGFGALYIAIIFAVWFIIDSIMEFSVGRLFRGVSGGYYWLTIIFSILGIILGVILLFSPVVSALTVVWIISVFLIIFGVLKIVQAFN